jgi:hypothetical protein
MYSYETGRVGVFNRTKRYYIMQEETYFSSEKKCKDAIALLGEDNVRKYVFGIK